MPGHVRYGKSGSKPQNGGHVGVKTTAEHPHPPDRRHNSALSAFVLSPIIGSGFCHPTHSGWRLSLLRWLLTVHSANRGLATSSSALFIVPLTLQGIHTSW